MIIMENEKGWLLCVIVEWILMEHRRAVLEEKRTELDVFVGIKHRLRGEQADQK